MAGRIRSKPLRLRRAFSPDTYGQDMPMWEQQIAASLESLAHVSAERWVVTGPITVSSNTSISALQAGWLLKVAPNSLIVDIALPSLDREDAGRCIAVQHVGQSRRVLRLGDQGTYVAACCSPGQIVQVVWDGVGWNALAGGVEWVEVPSGPELWRYVGGTSPTNALALAGWGGHKVIAYPSGAYAEEMASFRLPASWIGTDVALEAVVVPLVAGAGNSIWTVYWAFGGIDVAPAWVQAWASSPPKSDYQHDIALAITAAKLNQPLRVPFAAIPTPAGSMTNLDTILTVDLARQGNSGTDTYIAGAPNNMMLMRLGLRAQCCSVGSRTVV